jgi:hypothetical protein
MLHLVQNCKAHIIFSFFYHGTWSESVRIPNTWLIGVMDPDEDFTPHYFLNIKEFLEKIFYVHNFV